MGRETQTLKISKSFRTRSIQYLGTVTANHGLILSKKVYVLLFGSFHNHSPNSFLIQS